MNRRYSMVDGIGVVLLIANAAYAQSLVGRWICNPGNGGVGIDITFRPDGMVSMQVQGGAATPGTAKYTTNGNRLGGPGFTGNNEFRFAGNDKLLITEPSSGGLTCNRDVTMPAQASGEPDESYAWRLVMQKINSMWHGPFVGPNGKPCVGSRMGGTGNIVYEQIRGFRPNVRTELLPLSESDRLNGIQYRARYHFSAASARYYDTRAGWGQWQPFLEDEMPSADRQQHFGMLVEKRNGAWTANLFGTNMMYQRYAVPCESMP